MMRLGEFLLTDHTLDNLGLLDLRRMYQPLSNVDSLPFVAELHAAKWCSKIFSLIQARSLVRAST